MPQPQGLASSVEGGFLSRPPGDEIEDSCQIDVDCVSVPPRLALLPGVSDPQQVLAQGFIGIGYIVPHRRFQQGRGEPEIRMHSCKICHSQKSLLWVYFIPWSPEAMANQLDRREHRVLRRPTCLKTADSLSTRFFPLY